MKVQVQLSAAVPQRFRRALQAVPGVEVAIGPSNLVCVDEQPSPLVVLSRPAGTSAGAIRALAAGLEPGEVGMVVDRSIPAAERDALEQAGLSWCDSHGLHLRRPGTLVHLQGSSTGRASARGRLGSAGPQGIGPAGLRALQTLVSDHRGEWTLTALATQAGISTGQAHNVFKVLEHERLLHITGSGPRQRRTLTDRAATLDLLADLDRRRRGPQTASTFLYARTPDQLIARLSARLAEAGIPYALTGAAGAHARGAAVLSSLELVDVRVSVLTAPDTLDRIDLDSLDAGTAAQGANVQLWTDVGELGTHGASTINDVRVAPPVRVWLDLARDRGRGADAAELFRQQVLDRD